VVTGEVPHHVLVVDDDEQIRRMVQRVLDAGGYLCAQADDPSTARRMLDEEQFDLVLCDVNMPGASGLELAREILTERPGTAVVMVTGLDDPRLADTALELGAYGYVLKPFRSSELLINVSNALRRRRLESATRKHREDLERAVLDRTAALSEAVDRLQGSAAQLRQSHQETIRRLARALEYRDEETGGHVERVTRSSGLLAEKLGLDPEAVRLASAMHDVGKIAVPDRILRKAGPLSPDEWRVMRTHAEIGCRILSGSGSELLELAAAIAMTHHERYDGTGYPRGLRGEEIPIEGRIVAVADVFDALMHDRVYRPALEVGVALETMTAERAQHFDPVLLECFLNSQEEFLAIGRQVPGRLAGDGPDEHGWALTAPPIAEAARRPARGD
jgi:putative two-component system response regulator